MVKKKEGGIMNNDVLKTEYIKLKVMIAIKREDIFMATRIFELLDKMFRNCPVDIEDLREL